ncbi:MAG: hypothetical protein AAF915_08200 [Cyanobacteria bacterium P01_D01_bin.50]
MDYGLIFTIACPRLCGYAAHSLILDAFALIGLNPMDLLKNLIFKQASSENFQKLSDSWKQAVDILEKAGEKPFSFLRHFIFSQYNAKREEVQNKEYEWIIKNDDICNYSNDPVGFIEKIRNHGHP